jgi:dihydroorotate dehydrogenase (NAD+) catalytic subunit
MSANQSVVDLSTTIGSVRLKNPVIAAAGEHLQTASGIRAALGAGAAVVVAKSTNETAAARRQLEQAEYRLLDDNWSVQPWTFHAPVPPYILSRSGLVGREVDDWVAEIASLDREAASRNAYVAGSLVLADLEAGLAIARKFQDAGVRIFEFNIGTPYGDEARVVTTERSAERVGKLVSAMRKVLDRTALWVKLTSQSENVAALAEAARAAGADAVVLIGRPLAMLPDLDTMQPLINTNAAYGGRWALPLSCYWLARVRKALGPQFSLVGTNGARDGLDVARMLLSGASAVEMCTAVMAGGFSVIAQSLAELERYLSDKVIDVSALVGRAADSVQGFAEQPMSGSWRQCVPRETLAG